MLQLTPLLPVYAIVDTCSVELFHLEAKELIMNNITQKQFKLRILCDYLVRKVCLNDIWNMFGLNITKI